MFAPPKLVQDSVFAVFEQVSDVDRTKTASLVRGSPLLEAVLGITAMRHCCGRGPVAVTSWQRVDEDALAVVLLALGKVGMLDQSQPINVLENND